MRITERFKDGMAIIALEGKFVAGVDGPFLKEKAQELLKAGKTKLVFDFAQVPYIDSTGLGFLAATHTAAEEAGARVVLCSVPPQVKKIIDRVQLTKFFLIAEDQSAAAAVLDAPREEPGNMPGEKSKKLP